MALAETEAVDGTTTVVEDGDREEEGADGEEVRISDYFHYILEKQSQYFFEHDRELIGITGGWGNGGRGGGGPGGFRGGPRVSLPF